MSLAQQPRGRPPGFRPGGSAEIIQQNAAARSRAVSVAADAKWETLQTRPARIAYADIHTPQRFARGSALLGLADAAVGVQVAYPHLPGRGQFAAGTLTRE